MKTKPTGIRFDEEQLKFIQDREKIYSYQKVVNFLLSEYWMKYNGKWVLKEDLPQSKNNQQQIKQITTNQIVNQYEAYENELKLTQSILQIETIMREVKKDSSLNSFEKSKLELTAKTIGQQFDF